MQMPAQLGLGIVDLSGTAFPFLVAEPRFSPAAYQVLHYVTHAILRRLVPRLTEQQDSAVSRTRPTNARIYEQPRLSLVTLLLASPDGRFHAIFESEVGARAAPGKEETRTPR